MQLNYYDVLGVAAGALDTDIRRAYRKQAMEHHPDRNQGSKISEELFKQIQEAYAVLSDPLKRKAYDEGLASADEDAVSAFAQNPYAGSSRGDGCGYQKASQKPHQNATQSSGQDFYDPEARAYRYAGQQADATSGHAQGFKGSRWRMVRGLMFVFLVICAGAVYMCYEMLQRHPASFAASYAGVIPLAAFKPVEAKHVQTGRIALSDERVIALMNRVYGENHIRSGGNECWINGVSADEQFCMKPLAASVVTVDGSRLLYLLVSGREMAGMPRGISRSEDVKVSAAGLGAAIWDLDNRVLLASEKVVRFPSGGAFTARSLRLAQVSCNGAFGWMGGISIAQHDGVYDVPVLYVQKGHGISNVMRNMPGSFRPAQRTGGDDVYQYSLIDSGENRCIYSLKVSRAQSVDPAGERIAEFDTWSWAYRWLD